MRPLASRGRSVALAASGGPDGSGHWLGNRRFNSGANRRLKGTLVILCLGAAAALLGG